PNIAKRPTAADCWTITEDNVRPPAPPTPVLAPAADTGSSSPDNKTAKTPPTFTGTAEPGSMVTIYSDGVAVGSNVADDSTGAWAIITSVLSDGTHSITATATDAAGNISPVSGSRRVMIATVAPSPAVS